MSSLEQWLAYQTQVHPQAIDLGLDRLRLVLDRLGWRQPKVPVITIAGTNGKGSVSAYCASILKAAGYRVGSFTSPHLRDYREVQGRFDRIVSVGMLEHVGARGYGWLFQQHVLQADQGCDFDFCRAPTIKS